MEISEYLAKFNKILKREHPNEKKRTVEDYISTFAILPPFVDETKKCLSVAEKFRTKGNNMFGKGEFEEAALMHTRSLSNAPPYSKCAALAYANRSAALYRLKAYDECVSDINRALNLPYPNDLRAKIIARKAAAVNHKSMATTTTQTETDTPVDQLKLAYGENDKLPGVSQGIDIECGDDKKRYFVAEMPFKAGDVLIIQDPFMAVREFGEEPKYCHQCLKKSLCLIPCDTCTSEVYCSEKCRTEAYDTYHRIECKIQNTLWSAGISQHRQLLAIQLRCLNNFSNQGTDLKKLYKDIEEVDKNSDSEQLGFTEGKFSNTGKAFLSLLAGKKTAYKPEILFGSSYIATLLRNHTNFFQTNDDVPIVAKLLVRLVTLQATDYFKITYTGRQTTKAVAAQPLFSLVDHGCVDNTIAYDLKENRSVLRASQDINPGDKILYNNLGMDLFVKRERAGSSQMLQGKQVCRLCQTTFFDRRKKCPLIEMDETLRATLKKNPLDITGLWQLSGLLNAKLGPGSMQAIQTKLLLSQACKGCFDAARARKLFDDIGIRI